ncbi:MAG: ComEC/Rec2 family competence protein [Phycisphaerales bacterium]|nr:ComEC/Rec2 family competence protein [Phycisphaerales bacterium]
MKSRPEVFRPARRGVWAAGWAALGLLLADAAAGAAPWWAALIGGGVAGVLALVARGWACRVLLALALVLGAWGWHDWRTRATLPDDVGVLLSAEPGAGAPMAVEGIVATSPRVVRAVTGRLASLMPAPVSERRVTRFELSARSMGGQPVSGGLWVRVGGVLEGVRAGDVVRVTGSAAGLGPPDNPGERDIRPMARERGVSGRMLCAAPAAVVRVEGVSLSVGDRCWTAVLRAQERLRAAARAFIDPPEADPGEAPARALLVGMLLGVREEGLRDTGDAFVRVGLAHVLAVSGAHLAVFAGFLAVGLRVLSGVMGVGPRTSAAMLALMVVVYLLLVPAEAPIVRSALMILVFIAGEAAGRRYDRLNILGWTAVLVLLWRPTQLWDPGCQLSFAAVAGLILFTRRLRERVMGPARSPDEAGLWRRLGGRLADAAAASVVAWAVTSPIAAFHMGTFSPLAAPATLVTLPVVSALLGIGYLAFFASLVVPAVAVAAEPVLGWCAGALSWLVFAIDGLPGTVVYVPPLGLWATAALLGAVCVWLWAGMTRWSAAALAGALVWAGAATLPRADLPDGQLLRWDALAVGDGAAHLLRSGGEAVLYDCGSLYLDIGRWEMPRSLRALGVGGGFGGRRVRTAVVTHPDIDHFAALLDLVGPMGIERVVVGRRFVEQGEASPDGPAGFVLGELRRLGVRVEVAGAGSRVALGRLEIEFLSPADDARFRSDNDWSLVGRVRVGTEAGERVVLLTSDIESEAIRALAEEYPDLRAHALELPHHGTAIPDALRWVGRLDPAVIVQSTGARRLNDGRWDRLRDGRVWLTTAAGGAAAVVIRSDGAIEAGPVRGAVRTALAPTLSAPAAEQRPSAPLPQGPPGPPAQPAPRGPFPLAPPAKPRRAEVGRGRGAWWALARRGRSGRWRRSHPPGLRARRGP